MLFLLNEPVDVSSIQSENPMTSRGGTGTVDRAVIGLLRNNAGNFYSGSRLAAHLGVSRAAVHKHIAHLRTLGFEIEGTNRLGYRLGPSPLGFDPSELTGPLAESCIYCRILPSTQDEAKRRAMAGAPEGTLVIADRQTAGRGRLGRKWCSPSGGLWFSLVLRPDLPPSSVPGLTLVAALELAHTVKRLTGVPAGVKWPNDVFVDRRKLAGFLTEMSSESDRTHWMVLGVGINVNNRLPRDAGSAVALVDLVGKPVSRQILLQRWLDAFEKSYAVYRKKGFRFFRSDYNRHFVLRGKTIRISEGDGGCVGVALGVDAEGRLEMSTGGKRRSIVAGEISAVRAAT